MKLLIYNGKGPHNGYYLVPIQSFGTGIRFQIIASLQPLKPGGYLDVLSKDIGDIQRDSGLTYEDIGLKLSEDQVFAYHCVPESLPHQPIDFNPGFSLGADWVSPDLTANSGSSNNNGSTGEKAKHKEMDFTLTKEKERGDWGEESEKRAKFSKTQLFTRADTNSVKSGYRFGVATWNLHGLDKSQKDTVDYALSFEPYLESVEGDLNGEQKAHLEKLLAAYKRLSGQDVDRKAKKLEGKEKTYKSYNDICRALVRKLTCLSIVDLFQKHEWLDTLVLQEVKRTGIQILQQELKGKLCVHPGPKIKCSTSKGAESEFYPLVLRLQRTSNHHSYKLNLEKVWWLLKDGTSDKMELNDLRTDDDDGPNLTWNKHKDTFRPVVVYDLRIGDEPGPVVHVGVVHTTPGSQIEPLTGPQKKSVEMLKKLAKTVLGNAGAPTRAKKREYSGTRKKQRGKAIADSEFHRLAEFRQIDEVLELVHKRSYQEHKKFAGPWVLGGDYYLFEESSVVDVRAAYYSMVEEERKAFNALIDDEFQERIESYTACSKLLEDFQQQAMAWNGVAAKIMLAEQKTEKTRKPLRKNASKEAMHTRAIEVCTFLEQDHRMAVIKDLAADDCALLNWSSFHGEPITRGQIDLYRHHWLDAAQYYENLDDNDLLALCNGRVELYTSLCNLCEFYGQELKLLGKGIDRPSAEKLILLEEDNKCIMERSLTKYIPGKTRKGKDKKENKSKTVMGFTMRRGEDFMRAPLELTVKDQIPDGLAISQAVSGSNIPSGLMNEFTDAKPGDLAPYRHKLKVADFLIHTRYDQITNQGVNHWRDWCVGILSCDEGRILLADAEDLAVSRFWAMISDHFPVGGVLSTADEKDRALNRFASPKAAEGGGLQQEVAQLERARRISRISYLRKRGFIVNRCFESQCFRGSIGETFYVLMKRNLDEVKSLDELDEMIWNLEQYTDVASADGFDPDGVVFTTLDFDFVGHFTIGAADAPDEQAEEEVDEEISELIDGKKEQNYPYLASQESEKKKEERENKDEEEEEQALVLNHRQNDNFT